MAKLVEYGTLGVDTCQQTLDIYRVDLDQYVTIDNNRASIKRFLKSLKQPFRIAIEPTNTYHLEIVELAIEAGHEVYMINPYQLSKYREGVGVRSKTDCLDAKLLARYLDNELEHLRPYKLPSKAQRKLLTLLRRRGTVSDSKVALALSLKSLDDDLADVIGALMKSMDKLITSITKRMHQLIMDLGYEADYKRVKGIKGIGELNAIGLVALYHQNEFSRVDQYVAFMGMDIKLRDSGKYKGQSKLTKKGPAEMRRLLFMAGQAAAHTTWMTPMYERLLGQGRSKIAAKCIIARKLIRIAFSLLQNQTSFDINHCKYA